MADPQTPTKGNKSKFDASGVPTRLGRYKLEKLLGRGGMAGVYLAQDDQGRQVAVKVLAPSESEDPVGVERFHLEAELMSKLEHRNIVKVFEFNRAEGRTYLATEYVDGGTVRELTRQMGPMPASLAAEIIAQLLTGLTAAHAEGIIHRDLKPENMLLTRNGVMKLVDFGIARLAGQTRLTSTGTVLGTVQYMSPEQAQAGEIDARSDIFSAGTILYELLSGLNPFEGDTAVVSLSRVMAGLQTPVTELAPATPPALEAVLERMLAVDLKQRYASALHVLSDLEQVVAPARERAPNLLADCVARPVEIGVALRAGAARALIAEARKLSEGTTADKMLAAIKLHGAQVTHPQAGEATELLNRLVQALHLSFGQSKNPKVADLEKQLIGKPATTAVLIQLAQLYRLEGNVLAASRFYKRALRLKPTDGYIAGLLLQLTGERMGQVDDDEDQPTQMVPKASLQGVPVLAPSASPSSESLRPIVTGQVLAVQHQSTAIEPPPATLSRPAADVMAAPPPSPGEVGESTEVHRHAVALAPSKPPPPEDPVPVVVGLDGEGKALPAFDEERTGPGLKTAPGWPPVGPVPPPPSPPAPLRSQSSPRVPVVPAPAEVPLPSGPMTLRPELVGTAPGVAPASLAGLRTPTSGTGIAFPTAPPPPPSAPPSSSPSGQQRSPLPMGHVPMQRAATNLAQRRTPSGFFPTVPPSAPASAPSPVPLPAPRSSPSSPPTLAPVAPGTRSPSGFYAANPAQPPRGVSGLHPPAPPPSADLAAMVRTSSPRLPSLASGSHPPEDVEFTPPHAFTVLEEVSDPNIPVPAPAGSVSVAVEAPVPPQVVTSPPPPPPEATAAAADSSAPPPAPSTDPVGTQALNDDAVQAATRPVIMSPLGQSPAPGQAAALPAPAALVAPPAAPLLPPQYSPTGTPQMPLPKRSRRRRERGGTLLTLVALALLVAVCFDIGLRLRRPAPVVAQPPPPADPVPAPSGNSQAQAAVADARKAWRDGNAEKAIMALQAVAAQYPDTPEAGEALLQVADINLVRAQPRDARFALDAFLKAAPSHPRAAEAFLRRGQVEEELNDLPAAEADYREVLKAYDTSLLVPDAHLRLGLLLKKRGKVKEARDELGVALRQSRAGDNVNRQAFDALLKLQKQ